MCTSPLQFNVKSFMKLYGGSAKNLETLKYFPKILFSMNITDSCLLPCFYILFKNWFKNPIKELLAEVFLADVKMWKHIWWSLTLKQRHVKHKKVYIPLLSNSIVLNFMFSIVTERSKNGASKVNMLSILSCITKGYIPLRNSYWIFYDRL